VNPSQTGTVYGETNTVDYDPHLPINRANPCPEVTDQFCRLPLPTLFYEPEAVNLGDLLRIWVRLGARGITTCYRCRQQAIHHSLTITDFQGPDRVHRTPQEPWCFTTFASLSLAEPIPGIQDLNKKRQLFPRLDTTSVRLFALPLLVLYD
jgi:hypothetical protein